MYPFVERNVSLSWGSDIEARAEPLLSGMERGLSPPPLRFPLVALHPELKCNQRGTRDEHYGKKDTDSGSVVHEIVQEIRHFLCLSVGDDVRLTQGCDIARAYPRLSGVGG